MKNKSKKRKLKHKRKCYIKNFNFRLCNIIMIKKIRSKNKIKKTKRKKKITLRS